MKHEIDSGRYETNILVAFALGLFTTSTVYNYSLWKYTDIEKVGFMGTEIFFSYMTDPSNWHFFCLGITVCLVAYALPRVANYTEEATEQ